MNPRVEPAQSAHRWAVLVMCVLVVGSGVVAPVAAAADESPESVAQAYVEEFYPLWFSYHQTLLDPPNHLLGPATISPLYKTVVAINNDTLYVSAPVDLSDGPVIVTMPQSTVGYSVLALDRYGSIIEGSVPSKPYGATTPTTAYGLVPPGYGGSLPAGAVRVELPLVSSLMIIRIDKYSPAGQNVIAAAEQLRASLLMQPMADYELDPSGGAAGIVPEADFAIPYKTIADDLVRFDPIGFLTQLQTSVHAEVTAPLTPAQQALSDAFDALLAGGDHEPLRAGAEAAHANIVNTYLDHRGANNWIHFTNIGHWGDRVVERSAITEYIQYGNGIETAAYYQTFLDGAGAPLVGSEPGGYTLTFSPGGVPPAGRFWSVTAYTPDAIELIPNAIDKYEVASYTPGLAANADGSVTIHLAAQQPAGAATANWLPVADGAFNVMLRVYGVEAGSSVAANTYVPPAVLPASAPAPVNPIAPVAAPVAAVPAFTG